MWRFDYEKGARDSKSGTAHSGAAADEDGDAALVTDR